MELMSILQAASNSNSDIISSAILTPEDDGFFVLATTSPQFALEAKELGLNQLAVGFKQAFAGLSYDPNLGEKVWNVVIPLSENSNPNILAIKMKTEIVDEILSRTSRDSYIILGILVLVTLVLLANHIIFYQRSLRTKQLEELDKLKDEFISMAAHELRAPITGLTGYLQLLRDKIKPEQIPTLKDELGTLDILTQDLGNLINDLLDVSRIEQGRLKVDYEEIHVNEIIEKVVKSLAPLAKEKNLQIKCTPEDLPSISSDSNRIRQVINNLLSNAIKYSLKGEVLITAKPVQKDFIEVKIQDTGIGIPPEHISKLFSKFHRVKDEKTTDVRGSGLGLWITKEIVELLGGKIFAESIYGTGSVFTFTLPLSPPQ
jgi:signal transduction histidine kinase